MMTRNSRIREIQRKIGAEPDGFWGPKSVTACQKYLKGILEESYRESAEDAPPASDDKSMVAHYGDPGDEKNLIYIPTTDLGLQYDGKPVKMIRIHKKAARSLYRALEEVSNSESKWVLKEYAGCYNNRKMRGGRRPSKHAWGVAIDLCPDENMLNEHWPTSAIMPFEVMEIFAKHGWMSAGAFWSRDAMHFERTRP